MATVNINEAKRHLSRLLARVERGEEIVIARSGNPVARIVPLKAPAVRVPGEDRGKVRIAEDFDAPLPDESLNAMGLAAPR